MYTNSDDAAYGKNTSNLSSQVQRNTYGSKPKKDPAEGTRADKREDAKPKATKMASESITKTVKYPWRD